MLVAKQTGNFRVPYSSTNFFGPAETPFQTCCCAFSHGDFPNSAITLSVVKYIHLFRRHPFIISFYAKGETSHILRQRWLQLQVSHNFQESSKTFIEFLLPSKRIAPALYFCRTKNSTLTSSFFGPDLSRKHQIFFRQMACIEVLFYTSASRPPHGVYYSTSFLLRRSYFRSGSAFPDTTTRSNGTQDPL